jgi:iron complex transport system substrate-binding protein
MDKRKLKVLQIILIATLLAACQKTPPTQQPIQPTATPIPTKPAATPTQEPTTAPTQEPTAIPPEAPEVLQANITKGSVESYDPQVDYFPDKATIGYSAGWEVEYHNNYKVIRVLNPWRDAEETFEYVLVQRGTPIPERYDDAQIVEVPVESIATMSTTYLTQLDKLGLLEGLVGIDSITYVSTEAVRKMFDDGELVEIGGGSSVNVEVVLDLNPDLVMVYGVGNPEHDAHPKLLEAGVKVAMNAEYMETSPLGRGEWIKFIAMFFNREADAEVIFGDMAQQYEALAAKTREVATRPTLFTGAPRGDTWYMPGGNSYVAKFLVDAGADYLWAADDSTGSIPLDFESVYERAADADYWLNTSGWMSIDDALAADERCADFAALQNQRMYNNNARVNENGGNDYWESGVANPHLVLADLIKVFHPELVPDHEFVYYRQLDPASE